MGQYYVLVNHDKEEIVKPGKLGSGRKLWEITVSDMPRIMPYLMRQTASFGGGDPRVSGDYESKYQEARAEYEDISRRLAQQVREFIGDDDRSPRVPADPEQCDHEDTIIVKYGEEADGAGEWTCRDCHVTEEVDTLDELE